MSGETRSYWVPGRIEFLGKHTDYAGGRSLTCATERGITLHATPRGDARIAVTDTARGERAEFALSPALSPRIGHWSGYFMTVARRLAQDAPACRRGADLAFSSDLPQDAGLSSSSALVVGCYAALAGVNDLPARGLEDLAGYLGAVETGVGTQGGSQDHVAILCSRPNELGQYSFRPVRHERQVPLPRDHVFVVAVSVPPRANESNDENSDFGGIPATHSPLEIVPPGYSVTSTRHVPARVGADALESVDCDRAIAPNARS